MNKQTTQQTNYSFQINKNDEGRRIDRVIRKILPQIPLSGIYKLLRNGNIRVNNGKVKQSYKLKKGDTISLPFNVLAQNSPSKSTNKQQIDRETTSPPNIKTLIIEETEDYIVINKPKGMLVHGKNSLNQLVLNYLNRKDNTTRGPTAFTPGPIHRLDRNTSGLIIFSKTIRGAKKISQLFREHKIRKLYIGLAEGRIDSNLTIKSPIYRNKQTKISKIYSRKSDNKENNAITIIFPILHNKNLTLVACAPITGKTHQIRVHLSSIRHPLLGDTKYGGKKTGYGIILHAMYIQSETLKNFFAPLPKESYIILKDYFGDDFFEYLRAKTEKIIRNLP